MKNSTKLRRLLLFFTILASGGMLVFQREVLLVLIFIMSIVCIGEKVFTLNKRLLPSVIIIAVILMISIVFNYITISSLFIRFSVFIISIFLYNFYLKRSNDEFQNDLFVILKWMPLQAIITVLLALFTPFLFLTVPLSNATYKTVFFIFTYHETIEGLSKFVRPDGLFYEPGVFQLYLNILLYLSLFVFKKRGYSVLTIIAIFATQSTTGIVIGLFLLSYYFFVEHLHGRAFLSKVGYILGGVILLVPFLIIANANIQEKLYGESRGSSWARQYDLMTGINVALSKPLTGIGFDYERYKDVASHLGFEGTEMDEKSLEDRSNSNGIVFLFYSIGFPIGLLFIIGLFRQEFFYHKFLVGLILFLSLFGETLIFTPLFLLFIYSGFGAIFFKNKNLLLDV